MSGERPLQERVSKSDISLELLEREGEGREDGDKGGPSRSFDLDLDLDHLEMCEHNEEAMMLKCESKEKDEESFYLEEKGSPTERFDSADWVLNTVKEQEQKREKQSRKTSRVIDDSPSNAAAKVTARRLLSKKSSSFSAEEIPQDHPKQPKV